MPMSPRLLRPLARFQAPAAPSFSPSSIASLYMWLDASDAATLTLNGSAVSEWFSKAEAITFAQETAISQPLLLAAELNGKNVVSFDGTDDSLQAASPAVNQTPCTLIFVARWNESSDGIAAVFGQAGSQLVVYNGHDANLFRLYNGVDCQANQASAPGEWIVVSVVANGSLSKIYFNNLLVASGDAGDSGVGGNAYLGAWLDGSDFTKVDLAEALSFDEELSPSDMNSIHGYLFAKWGIPGT